MPAKKTGNQTPTKIVSLPYRNTYGPEAVEGYEKTGKSLMPWQQQAMYDILAYSEEEGREMYIHSTVGYSIPRRNGKGEVLACRELYGLENGEIGMHTAHLATTSSDAAERLARLLRMKGYTEVLRPRADEEYPGQFSFAKQKGQEVITFLWGDRPCVYFRTRTSTGGLGIEKLDYVVIDEAQMYTEKQATALAYVMSASLNPQTIMCGTPPTIASDGTVFPDYREKCLSGDSENSLWFEWSVNAWTDPKDEESWYLTNPSLGITLTKRNVKDEIAKTSPNDFNIQRLGLWITYSQKSEISEEQWKEMIITQLPKFRNYMQVGIKFSKNGLYVAMAIGIKAEDGRIYSEVIDCRPISAGFSWIISFLKKSEYQTVAIDGANGQKLIDEMKDYGIKKQPLWMSVKDVIRANTEFSQGIGSDDTDAILCHSGQPSVDQVATNCQRRTIGSNGGFGYSAINDDDEIALLDSMIIAFWLAKNAKEKRKRTFVC